jgi:heavy metal sensor kinase
MRRLRSSLRFRLTAWYAASMLFLLSASSAFVYLSVKDNWERNLFRQQEQDFSTVRTFLELSPTGVGKTGYISSDIMFMVEEGGKIVLYSTGMFQSFLQPLVTGPEEFLTGGIWRSRVGKEYVLRSFTMATPEHDYLVTTAIDTMPVKKHLSTLFAVLCLVLGAGTAAVGAVGFLLADRALQPLGKMADAAHRITVDNLSERLPVINPSDELGRIALIFNETLDRLKRSFDGLSAFTADVSHELRTPLTAIRSVGEVALRTGRNASGYRDTIGSMLEEADRLSALIGDMLILARADSGYSRLSRTPTDLNALVRSAVDLLLVLAEERNQSLSVDFQPAVFCSLDENAMRRVLINVLDNAIRFTPPGGRIRVLTWKTAADRAVIDVIDEAARIPDEAREAIFLRFRRLDADRGRDSGGVGLGLAIAKRTVESHRGLIAFVDHSGKGNCCRIELPAL